MKIKSILAALLFVLTISACSEEDATYEEVQSDVNIDSKESTKGKEQDEQEPYPPA